MGNNNAKKRRTMKPKDDSLRVFDLIRDGKSISVIRLFDKKTVDINTKKTDHDGRTCLFHACDHRCLEVVKYLLAQKEIKINEQNEWGWTPLHVAAWNGFYEIVLLLLKHGADKSILNMMKETPKEKSLFDFDAIFDLTEEEIKEFDEKKELELLHFFREDYEEFLKLYMTFQKEDINSSIDKCRRISWLHECIHNDSIVEQLLLTQYVIDRLGVSIDTKDRFGRKISEYAYFCAQRKPVSQVISGVRLKDNYLKSLGIISEEDESDEDEDEDDSDDEVERVDDDDVEIDENGEEDHQKDDKKQIVSLVDNCNSTKKKKVPPETQEEKNTTTIENEVLEHSKDEEKEEE